MSKVVIQFISYLAITLLSMTTACADQAKAVYAGSDTPVSLTPYIQYIEDPDRSLSYEQVKSTSMESQWLHVDKIDDIGIRSSTKLWFRVDIINLIADNSQRDLDSQMVVYFNTPPAVLYEIDLWISENSQLKHTIETGFLKGINSRELQTDLYAFKMNPDSKNISFIGSIDNSEISVPVLLNLFLTSSGSWEHLDERYQRVLIGFYAVMFALLFYNACLLLTLREPLYAYYLIFIVSATFTCASQDGTMMRLIFPNLDHHNVKITNTLGILLAIAYVVFVWEALNRLKHSPIFNKVYKTAFMIGFICLLFNGISEDYAVSNMVVQVYSGLSMPLVLVAILFAIRDQVFTASYLLLAELCTCIGGTIFLMEAHGLVPTTPTTYWALHIGFFCEVLLLSLAMAERTRQAQEESIESLENYEALYENSVEGRFQYSLMDDSVRCNQSLADICGYPSIDALLSENPQMQLADKATNEKIEYLLLKEGRVIDFETTIKHQQSQKDVWVSMNMRMIRNAKNMPERIEGSLVDISERKLKETAEQDKQIVEAQNQAKSQFFASMSHEFRTPLTAILGYTDLANREQTPIADKNSHIKTISHSANHLLQLINDILDLSKLEAQQMDIEEIPVNLMNLISDVHGFTWILAQQKEITFEVDYVFPLPEIITSDPTRLKQALINLCSNSVKFTQEGGVTLRVSFDDNSQQLSFAVQDTGIGLKPDQLDKLFQAFTQADNSTSRNYGGTGLGLHLSKLIANKLGGDICVESLYGKGSTFTLSLLTSHSDSVTWLEGAPESIIEESVIEQAYDKSTIGAENKTTNDTDDNPLASFNVLLADDNPVNQKLLRFHLEQSGVDVSIASDGLEAIAKALTEDIDFVLMDMDMPYLDGLQAVTLLRDKGYEKPIYALTGNVDLASIQACLEAGCDGHLAKPIDTVKLTDVINSLMHNNIPPTATSAKPSTHPPRYN